MRELIERLEKAEGPKRSLDGEIAATLKQNPIWAVVQRPRQPELFVDGGPGLRQREWLSPEYTGSLDAALALAESLLPGSPIAIIDNYAGDKCAALIGLNEGGKIDLGNSMTGIHSSRAIALCIAILKAKESERG